jgi:hypothetical protein
LYGCRKPWNINAQLKLMILTERFTTGEDGRAVWLTGDCTLIGAIAAFDSGTGAAMVAGAALISFDPSARFSWVFTPPNNQPEDLTIGVVGGVFLPLKIPLSKDSRIFVSCNSAGLLTLYFELPI